MRLNLDPETGGRGLGAEEASEPTSPVTLASLVFEGVSAESRKLAQMRVQEVILAALEQRLPRARPLQAWEPQKLHSRHISMLCDRASGMTPGEISARYKMNPVYVNVILTHPDSLVILGAMQALNADKMTDVNARLQGYAHEMLTGKIEIFRKTQDNRLKDSIATDILDRAGYGPRQKVDINASHRFVLPAAAANSMAEALREDQRVSTVDYRAFTGRRLGQEAQALGSGESTQLAQAEPEPLSVVSASPDASSESERQERVA